MYVYLLIDSDDEFSRRNIVMCETEEQAKKLVEVGYCDYYQREKILNDKDIEEIIEDRELSEE